jgi:hypothetical protein
MAAVLVVAETFPGHSLGGDAIHKVTSHCIMRRARKVDVRLPGKGDSNSMSRSRST